MISLIALASLAAAVAAIDLLPYTLDSDPLLAPTSLGVIHGKWNADIVHSIAGWFGYNAEKNSRVWAGIPFAQPPIGPLRFHSPLPITQPWGSVSKDGAVEGQLREATEFPSPCPQNWITTATQSEDCLYLNVFVPPPSRTPPGKLLLVMVWIFGGAFFFGDSYMSGVYNARYLVENKDVIVVTINHRLGAFGFFDTDETGANFAIEDQRMAFEWVQANIAGFHGDPTRVTIYGISSGATSVAAHLTSPLTRPGLFSRVIHQSGPPGTQMRRRVDIQKVSRDLARTFNCIKPDGFTVDVQCMRSVSMEDILRMTKDTLNNPGTRPEKSWWDIEPGSIGNSPMNSGGTAQALMHADQSPDDHISAELGDQYIWWPSIDGKNIVGQPRDLFSQGHYVHVPTIMGVTTHEAAYFFQTLGKPGGQEKAQLMFNSTAQLNHFRNTFGRDANKVLRVYPVHPDTQSNVDEMIRLSTAYAFTCPTQRAAESMAKNGDKNVYVYEINMPGFPPYGLCAHLTCHGTELPLMYRTLLPSTQWRKRLMEQMFEYWTNFAASGDPNRRDDGTPLPPDVPRWPNFDMNPRSHQELSYNVGPQGPLREVECKLWNDDLGYGFGVGSFMTKLGPTTQAFSNMVSI